MLVSDVISCTPLLGICWFPIHTEFTYPFYKIRNLEKKIKQSGPFAKEFHIISSFWALKTSSDGDHHLSGPLFLCWSPFMGKMLLFISSLNLSFQLRPSLSSSHRCHWEAFGLVFSGTSALALGGLCWGLLMPSLLQPWTSLVPQPLLTGQVLRPLTISMIQIWTHYTSQFLIYIKITTNDSVKARQQ